VGGGLITLPWPPTVNHYYTVARGRKILSKKGREYKKTCALEMMVQRIPQDASVKRYCISINAYPPSKRRHDLDNLLKPILDALVDYGAIEDDSQVDDLRIQRFNPVKGGRIEVLIS